MKLDTEVLIVGSGFCGLAMAIRLRMAGIPFVLLEKASDLGGTWRDNTYPGIAVDITSFTYSYSFAQNPSWSRVFAPGAELKRYADDVAAQYDLRRSIRFDAEVVAADFDEDDHVWRVTLASGDTLRARFLVNACGVLTKPKIPAFAGLESFRGKVMHTARWEHDYDLRGRRVAVIGTGATAVQLVPSIADQVEELTVYQRTPIWIVPKFDAEIPETIRAAFDRVPGLQRAVRLVTTSITELLMVVGVVYNAQSPWLIRALERACRDHLHAQVKDPALRAALTPNYGLFCKRPTFSNDFYPTLAKPNVELVTEGITRFTKSGVVDESGTERAHDLVVMATGFYVTERENMPSFPTRGVRGLELGQFWDDHRLQAYEGTSVPGFPNHFMMVGPYSVTGASWFSIAEAQSRHALRCIERARTLGATRVEVKREANARYLDQVLSRMPSTVFFHQDCNGSNSYYFDRHGDAPLFRPAGGLELELRSRFFDLDDYAYA